MNFVVMINFVSVEHIVYVNMYSKTYYVEFRCYFFLVGRRRQRTGNRDPRASLFFPSAPFAHSSPSSPTPSSFPLLPPVLSPLYLPPSLPSCVFPSQQRQNTKYRYTSGVAEAEGRGRRTNGTQVLRDRIRGGLVVPWLLGLGGGEGRDTNPS